MSDSIKLNKLLKDGLDGKSVIELVWGPELNFDENTLIPQETLDKLEKLLFSDRKPEKND